MALAGGRHSHTTARKEWEARVPPVCGDAESHRNRSDGLRGLGPLHPPSSPCSGCLLFHCIDEKTEAWGLSHFLSLQGWQVAARDGSQAQGVGLCCALGAGGGGHVTRERQGSHLSSLGFTFLA